MEWVFDFERIKVGRESRDVSQQELAQKMGVAAQQVSLWETGRVSPGMASLVSICNALQLPPRFFFARSVPNVHDDEE